MSNLRFWGKVIISVVGCGALVWWIDWEQSAQILKRADGYCLLAVFVAIHMDRAFMAYKWSMLLRRLGVPISRKAALQAYYVGAFWSTFLPSSVGGDVVRASWLIDKGHSSAWIISSIVIERLLGALALAVVSLGSVFLLTLYVKFSMPGVYTIVGLLLAEAGLCLIAIFSRRTQDMIHTVISRLPFKPIRSVLDKIGLAALAFRDHPRLLVVFLLLSIVEQAFPILATYLLARALDIHLSLAWAIIGVPLIAAVSRLPISINAWGVREGAFAFIFAMAGLPLTGAVMVSLADRMLLMLAALPGTVWTVSVSKPQIAPQVAAGRSDLEGAR